MHGITRGLLDAGHQVKVLCISTPKHPLNVTTLPAEYRERTRIEGVFIDTSLNIVDAFTDLVTADNYNISRFFSPDMDIRLTQLLAQEEFDVIHLESLFTTPYLPTLRRYSRARIVLRSHNLEHVIQERIAQGERNILKKPYRRFLAKQLKTYEREVLGRVDGVAAITLADARHLESLGSSTPIVTVPFGLATSEYDAPALDGPPIFFHLGSMDWLPNEEGIRWLLRTVWPRVLRKHPEAKLHLAGNSMPKDLLRAHIPGTVITGHVPDATGYMAQRHVMVVPLFSAGGMRVKIVEGMALGKCVISTPVGAEGIRCTNGENILIAGSAPAFTEMIDRVLTEPELAPRIGENARQLVHREHTNAHAIHELVALYSSLAAT
jgi:glycosyltransferase involved in cell wall biosynthesis